MGNLFFKKAFTLAEVLIALGIIGVIAAMTIPTLIQKQKDDATIKAVKKSYSILSQAFLRTIADNGTPNSWDLGTQNTGAGAIKVSDYFVPYLNIIKDCNNSGGCFPSGTYKTVNNTDTWDFSASGNQFATVKLADGSSIAFWSGGSSACVTYCGFIIVDVNGYKKPNRYGYDTFWFWLRATGIIPYGDWNSPLTECDKSGSSTSDNNGRSCTPWVLQNENVDYLYCTGLSWSGPTQCP